jgi:hypothetical protein
LLHRKKDDIRLIFTSDHISQKISKEEEGNCQLVKPYITSYLTKIKTKLAGDGMHACNPRTMETGKGRWGIPGPPCFTARSCAIQAKQIRRDKYKNKSIYLILNVVRSTMYDNTDIKKEKQQQKYN